MTATSNKIVELLHMTRSGTWTADDSLMLSDAIREASPAESKIALLDFGFALLAAAKNVVTIQRNAAMLAELHSHDGKMQ